MCLLQEVGMPPPPLRRLVRAGSSSSIDSQQPKAGRSQASAPTLLASASLAQAAIPAAANPAAGTAAAAPSAAAELLKPQFHSQSQPGRNSKASRMQSGLGAQYVGEYQQQPDEEDVDILGDSVPLILRTQKPALASADQEAVLSAGVAGAAGYSGAGVSAAAAEEAAPDAGIPEATGNGVAEAQVPTQDVAGTLVGAGNAPAENAAEPLPTSRLGRSCHHQCILVM